MNFSIIAAVGAALLTLLIPSAGSAQGTKGINSYRETVDLSNEGWAKVTLNVTIAGGSAETIVLPLNFANARGFSAEGSGIGAVASAVKIGDVNVISVRLDHAPTDNLQLKIAFTADKFFDWSKPKLARGVYSLSYTFTNTTPSNIGNYELKMVLPSGYNMNGIISSTPKATGEEVVPPCDFATENGRLSVNLRSRSVDAGKTAAITFGVRPIGGSPLPAILIGLLIAAFGIYLKRDVLTRADFVRDAAA